MQTCVIHGKKRQLSFLQLLANGEYVCRPQDVCKLSGAHRRERISSGGLHHSRQAWAEEKFQPQKVSASEVEKAEDHIAHNSPSTDEEPVGESTLQPSQSGEMEQVDLGALPYSSNLITSWADEVDKEFPQFPDESADDKISAEAASPSSPPAAPLPPSTGGTPTASGINPNRTEHKSKRPAAPVKRVSTDRSMDLIERVRMLEGELGHTKKELRRTKEEMDRMLMNEKALEGQVRNLCTEIMLMRQHQQLEARRRAGADDPASPPAPPFPTLQPPIPTIQAIPVIQPLAAAPPFLMPHTIPFAPRLNPNAPPFLLAPHICHNHELGPASSTTGGTLPADSTTMSSARSTPYVDSARSALYFDSGASTQCSARSTTHMDSARSSTALADSNANLNSMMANGPTGGGATGATPRSTVAQSLQSSSSANLSIAAEPSSARGGMTAHMASSTSMVDSARTGAAQSARSNLSFSTNAASITSEILEPDKVC